MTGTTRERLAAPMSSLGGSELEAARPRLRGVSHQIAFFAAVPAAVAVTLTTHGGVARAAAAAFALSVAAMFGVSSIFHRGSWTPAVSRRLGRLDHAMIYALIAGTYAPIGLLVLHRGWRVPILATVWGCACLAALVKLVWARPPTWLAPAISVGLGWTAVLVLPQIIDGIGLGPAPCCSSPEASPTRSARSCTCANAPTPPRRRSATTSCSMRS